MMKSSLCHSDTYPKNITISDRYILFILVIGIVFRILISLANNGANDNHVIVSQLITQALQSGNVSPPYDACSTCYHPRLFHFTTTLPCILGTACSPDAMGLFGQLFNTTLSCLMLFIVGRWLSVFLPSLKMRRVIFALVAFNPRLIYIGSQASTDMCAIFFGVACAYYWHLYIATRANNKLILAFLSFVLCFFSKGTAMALAGGIGVSFLMTVWLFGKNRKFPFPKKIILLFIFGTFAVMYAAPDGFSPYGRYFQQMLSSGRPGAVNFGKMPHVPFYTPEYVSRPGVVSIVHSYFTFRFIDLIEHPWITQGVPPIPINRTSFWSQLYGRYHFIFFDQWPFERVDVWALIVGRASIIAAFFPTMIFVIGVLSFIKCLFSRNRDTQRAIWVNQGGCVVPIGLAYIAMLLMFTYSYRGFDAMKAGYMLPGFLGYLAMYVRGLRVTRVTLKRYQAIGAILQFNLWVLVFVYLCNFALMMQYLLVHHLPG